MCNNLGNERLEKINLMENVELAYQMFQNSPNWILVDANQDIEAIKNLLT